MVNKAGKVLAAEPGGPAATVEVVKKLVASSDATAADTKQVDKVVDVKATEEPKAEEAKPATNGVNGTATEEDVAKANVAAEVANTAEKLDSNVAAPA